MAVLCEESQTCSSRRVALPWGEGHGWEDALLLRDPYHPLMSHET